MGINLKWDYYKLTCRLMMKDYIYNLRAKFDHLAPKNLITPLTATLPSTTDQKFSTPPILPTAHLSTNITSCASNNS